MGCKHNHVLYDFRKITFNLEYIAKGFAQIATKEFYMINVPYEASIYMSLEGDSYSSITIRLVSDHNHHLDWNLSYNAHSLADTVSSSYYVNFSKPDDVIDMALNVIDVHIKKSRRELNG